MAIVMPAALVQVLTLLFRRENGGQDPPGRHVADTNKRVAPESAAYGLLGRSRRIPWAETISMRIAPRNGAPNADNRTVRSAEPAILCLQ